MKKSKMFGYVCLAAGFFVMLFCVAKYTPYLTNLRAMEHLRSKAQSMNRHTEDRGGAADDSDRSSVDLLTEDNKAHGLQIDFGYLNRINEDITGWIYIPDTHINYPVLQGDTLEEYLEKSYDGSASPLGSVFAPPGSQLATDSHCILFGHRTFDRQMFGDLEKLSDRSFGEGHCVYLYTGDICREYEVIASYCCPPSDISFNVDLDTVQYFSRISEKISGSGWMGAVDPAQVDDMLTLVTCPPENSAQYRMVVQCISRTAAWQD